MDLISVPVVHGTCGILSLNTYQTLFTFLFCYESRHRSCTHGWADNIFPKANKCIQLSKNGILVNQKWDAAEDVINTSVGISVCEVQSHCKVLQLARLVTFTVL